MPPTLPPPEVVFNQPPILAGYNAFAADTPLQEALEREGAAWARAAVHALGAVCGSAEALEQGRLANAYPPVLHVLDRHGHRRDEVEYHPAYHALMRLGIEHGLHSQPWAAPRAGAHVARAAMMMLRHQLDEGSSCPLTMTYAVLPSLRLQPALAATWAPRILSEHYDPRLVPAHEKAGCLFGMAMTERQGGTDVRANTTRAEPDGEGAYRLQGHKWFCSAPNSDGFLVLAQAPGGLTCLLLPRFLPDGTRNALHFVRLKDKLGNRSNASGEVNLEGAWAQRIGEEGRGVPAIIEMVRHTRLDCALGSAATLRRAVAEATHHAAWRQVFGKPLLAQPLMRNVLADLCLESEAATALVMRLARGFDAQDEAEVLFTRLATPVAKYWITRRAIAGVAEALECLGGNGYVEASGMPRLYRDVPVNAIWEGSGNVQCLDVLRAAARAPAALEAVLAEIDAGRGGNRHLDAFARRLKAELGDPAQAELRARRMVEHLALGLQAALLVHHAPPAIADAFCASRLDAGGLHFGTLPPGLDYGTIIERARPQLPG